LLVRVASQVLRFAIPVLVIAVLGVDVVATSVVVIVVGVGGKVMEIGVVSVVREFDVVVVGVGIDVSVVGYVVVVSGTEGGCIVPFVGAVFCREISPLGVYLFAMTRWRMVLPVWVV
jgi:hypothetical protein